MAQNITLMGASYSDVPAVELPKTGGGIATFFDVDGSQTVTQNGTYDVAALAQMVVNVAGGGGSGLEYEEGTVVPEEDVTSLYINFSNSHDSAPAIFVVAEVSSTGDITSYTNYTNVYVDFLKLFGSGVPQSSSSFIYGVTAYAYRTTSTGNFSTSSYVHNYPSTDSSSSGTGRPRFFATETWYRAYAGSSRYWRTGRTYKWIGIWKS